jgi:hypothetical protein
VSTQTLGNPVLSGSALRWINFFNGRLLTGDDLRGEQSTLRARLQQHGLLTGTGVAYGLEVQETAGTSTPQNPVVTVAGGLAGSPSGLALWLPSSVDLSLAGTEATSGTEPGALFAPCQPFAPGTYTAGAGVYLLWIGPASQSDGLAQVNGLGNQVAPCNVDDNIDTVQFGLIRLALALDQLDDRRHLRSLVAFLCFAPDALASFVTNPFGPPLSTYGLIDTLRAQQVLTDDQVPLAIFGWDIDDGIQFVDEWSVRRRVTRRAAEGDFTAFAGDRRRAEGEAMFLQFQGAIADLRSGPGPQTLAATSAFTFLPAAGLLPLVGQGLAQGFDLAAFFSGLTTRGPVYVNGAEVDALIQRSFTYAPIGLTGGEVTWLYLVRENSAAGPSGDQGYALFASGHIPYAANAHFDLSVWDYSNYGLV